MRPLKILIIDDDPTTCALLKTTLEMEGHQTSAAHQVEGEDILLLLRNEKPDVLFLDYYLESGETLKHLATIRNDPDWKNLSILMTSAIDHSQDCLEAGANSFILKPFNWEEITEMINEIRNQILNREEM
jgi:two-component system phosphate regulon response regulator PhoB